MSFRDSLFLGFSVIGGVGLFILGLSILTEGLRGAAGDRIRWILFKATRNRVAGVIFGALLGVVAHSTAATVMAVGFTNAGLMALRNAVPLLMGASIGTTLAMQLISFRLSDYAFAVIAIGFFAQIALPWAVAKHLGRSLVGFGLLFLGLDFVTGSIEPYREYFSPLLARIDGTTWSGTFFGIFAAIVVTGLIQSSGATIGLLFALIAAGAFTSLEQVFPIVLGAHIGTAGTALVVSIGANLEARRTAIGNLLFQVFNVAFALLLSRLLLPGVEALGGDLVRQAANLHTAVMVIAVAALLPVLPLWVRFIYAITPAKSEVPQSSFLNPEFSRMPERAIYATLQELGRVTAVCRESFQHVSEELREQTGNRAKRIRLNESVINEVKDAVKDYLATLTRGRLSRRQALMVQHLNRMVANIERIGDHVESMHETLMLQQKRPEGQFDKETTIRLFSLVNEAETVLAAVAKSLDPKIPNFEKAAAQIIATRDQFDRESVEAKHAVNERIANHAMHPLAGLHFSEYVSALDRIVRHCKMIAREQEEPYFRIKEKKLDRKTEWVKRES